MTAETGVSRIVVLAVVADFRHFFGNGENAGEAPEGHAPQCGVDQVIRGGLGILLGVLELHERANRQVAGFCDVDLHGVGRVGLNQREGDDSLYVRMAFSEKIARLSASE